MRSSVARRLPGRAATSLRLVDGSTRDGELERSPGYISGMTNELRDVMADLELSLVDTVARLEKTEMDLLYVGVLDLEQRIAALHDALAFVADNIAAGTMPTNEPVQHLP